MPWVLRGPASQCAQQVISRVSRAGKGTSSITQPMRGRTELRCPQSKSSARGKPEADADRKEWRALPEALLAPSQPWDPAMLPVRVSQPQRSTMPPDTSHVPRRAHLLPRVGTRAVLSSGTQGKLPGSPASPVPEAHPHVLLRVLAHLSHPCLTPSSP